MSKAQNSTKRILTVTIKRTVDDSPDTSWLGEYSNEAVSEYSIDRKHSLDCIANTGCVWDKMLHVLYECGICDYLHPWDWSDDCRDDDNRYADSGDYAAKHGIKDLDVTVVSWEDRQSVDDGCTCEESGDAGRNEYRYFNPSDNYKDYTPEDIRKYVRQDYDRMESLNRDNWCFIGVYADAAIVLGNTRQTITSGGLGGIESDSGSDYFAEIEQEQLAELREQLHAIGFSKRAISAAFKNVERSE
jgi:hypothetical protein